MTSSGTYIDTHVHYDPPSYFRALERYAESADDAGARLFAQMHLAGHAKYPHTLESRLERMEAGGVATSVLSLPPPGIFDVDEGLGSRTASEANDELIAAAESYSGRFLLLAALPIPHVEASLKELDRVASHPVVRGVGLMTSIGAWTLDEPRFLPIFERCAELDLPVVLHGSVDGCPDSLLDWGLVAGLGMLFGATVSVLRLALAGTFDKVPDLTPIVTHLGGGLPFMVKRIDEFGRLSGLGAGDAQHEVLHYCQNRLYFDNALFNPPSFQCVIDTCGAERVILGSDGFLESALEIVQQSSLPADVQEKILGGTAARWFSAADVRTSPG
jgi:aminocarboxymuconate-semialdehyde decarboxylase